MVRVSFVRAATILLFMSGLIFLAACSDVQKKEGLAGLSEAALIEKLGQPESQAFIKLDKDSQLHEYQSDLYKIIKPSFAGSIGVKELRWKKSNETLVVWLKYEDGKLVSFDNLAWSDDVRF